MDHMIGSNRCPSAQPIRKILRKKPNSKIYYKMLLKYFILNRKGTKDKTREKIIMWNSLVRVARHGKEPGFVHFTVP